MWAPSPYSKAEVAYRMNTQTFNEVNVGIDTSHSQLDIYVRLAGDYFSFSNNATGAKAACKKLAEYHPERVLIEATGRLELAFVLAAEEAGLPLVVCNPAQVRKFAQATGRAAKTDKLDAQDIAYFGELLKPSVTQIKPQMLRDISDLLATRSQFLEMSTMQKNRLQRMPKSVHGPIKRLLKNIVGRYPAGQADWQRAALAGDPGHCTKRKRCG